MISRGGPRDCSTVAFATKVPTVTRCADTDQKLGKRARAVSAATATALVTVTVRVTGMAVAAVRRAC